MSTFEDIAEAQRRRDALLQRRVDADVPEPRPAEPKGTAKHGYAWYPNGGELAAPDNKGHATPIEIGTSYEAENGLQQTPESPKPVAPPQVDRKEAN